MIDSVVIQVGTISANGEKEIGDLIARAMERVGKEGVITVSVSHTIFAKLSLHSIASKAAWLLFHELMQDVQQAHKQV